MPHVEYEASQSGEQLRNVRCISSAACHNRSNRFAPSRLGWLDQAGRRGPGR